MTIYPTGLDPTDVYSVNFPSLLHIPLESYYLGPNINYQILNHKGDTLPASWIDKVNKTRITIDKPPKVGDITFFHTDVIPQLGY